MNILPMEERHLETLAEIERACFSAPWSIEALREELKNPEHLFFVAEEESMVLGYVGCQTVLDEGYITNVAVSPAARRRGIARALLLQLEISARQRNLTFLTLEVRQSNCAARTLYAHAGYKSVGLRKGFYHSPKEDAVLMTLYLNQPEIIQNREKT